MFKIGDKVKPFKKSLVFGTGLHPNKLSEEDAIENLNSCMFGSTGKPLFIVDIAEEVVNGREMTVYTLSDREDECSGNWYLEEDLSPYLTFEGKFRLGDKVVPLKKSLDWRDTEKKLTEEKAVENLKNCEFASTIKDFLFITGIEELVIEGQKINVYLLNDHLNYDDGNFYLEEDLTPYEKPQQKLNVKIETNVDELMGLLQEFKTIVEKINDFDLKVEVKQ